MCQLGSVFVAETPNYIPTTTPTAIAPCFFSRLKMADTSRNGGKILNEGKKLTPSLSKNSSGNNDVVPTLLTTPDPLPAEPMNPDFDKGRPATHRIDTQGSVQALVVDGDVVIAGLQDGTLAVSFRPSFSSILC